MDTFQLTLLFDYYGNLLTDRQQMCFDLHHNQDLTLTEIAQELHISRQGVYDNLNRAETLLQNMEEKTGCVHRDLQCRAAAAAILETAQELREYPDRTVTQVIDRICAAVKSLEE